MCYPNGAPHLRPGMTCLQDGVGCGHPLAIDAAVYDPRTLGIVANHHVRAGSSRSRDDRQNLVSIHRIPEKTPPQILTRHTLDKALLGCRPIFE